MNGSTVYVVSNTTHVWINASVNLASTQGLSDGDSFTIGGREWKILDVGKYEDGDPYDYIFRVMLADRIKICLGEECSPFLELNVSDKYDNNRGMRFCVESEKEWKDYWGGESCDEGQTVYVVSNSTHVWINASTDLTESSALTTDDEFELNGTNWKVVSVDEQQFRVKRANGICGEFCTHEGEELIEIIPPQLDGNFYFGKRYFREICDDEGCTQDRPVYFYNNGTTVWITNETNMTNAPHNTTGGVIMDTYGALWNITLIKKNEVTLSGINVSAGSYIFVNTSLSKSGIFMKGEVETKEDMVYLLVADTNLQGVYDTLIISNDSENFLNGNIISVHSNQSEREIFEGMYLLSIDPRGTEIMFYRNNTGDWPELGDYRYGDNITIPVIVKRPGGGSGEINLTIDKARNDETGQIILINSNVTTCNSDLCEIKINLQDYNISSGRYAFGIIAESSEGMEKMKDWKWPRATTRKYLVTTYSGYAHMISGFEPVKLERFGWENYGDIHELRNETRCGGSVAVLGVMRGAHP